MATAKKPAQPKTTSGNLYRPPGQSAGRIVGRYKVKPKKIGPGLVLKKRGGNLGYVTIRKPKPAAKAAPAPAAAAAPAPPPGPYDGYRETAPWAIPLLQQIDRDQTFHTQYASGVGDWLSKALTGLTGVDPANPGFNQTAQQQYLANVAGSTGAALNSAAIAAPPVIDATTGGGIVQGNNAFVGEAARDASAQRSSAALQQTQAQSALNSIQSNTYAQGAIRAFADLQAGLPQIYAERRMEQRGKIDQFIAEQQQAAAELQEEMRANKVQEAISAQNAQTNAAIQFGRLGLSAEELAQDSAQPTGPVPTGYVQLPDGRYVRDPTVPSASSAQPRPAPAPSAARGQYPPNKLRKEGYTKLSPKAGPKWKQNAVRATDGSLWIKKGSGQGGTKPPKPKAGSVPFDVQKDLQYSLDNSFIDDTDQSKGTPQLLRFLRKHQPQSPNAFANWWKQILPVLIEQDPKFGQWMVGYRQRRIADGSWKGRF